MAEHGLRDYRQAKLKAAASIGIHDEAGLPGNNEVEDALREHQRLFQSSSRQILRHLRKVAADAMRFFAAHEPRLVGTVLEGTADAHSAVCLHLHTDEPEMVIANLVERGIPHQVQARRLRLDRATTREFPALGMHAGDTPIDLTLLPYDRLRQAPLDRISERPMRRASLAALQALLSEPTAAGQDCRTAASE